MNNRELDYYFMSSDGSKHKVRRLQEEVLTIMDEMDRICRKNKIEYFLIAGSSIGINNYNGFVPWDDDMDVAVHRKDWNKFVKALNKDLKNDYYFDCYETNKKYNVISGPNMKIRKRGTYLEEVNFLLKNRCGTGDGIFLDIIKYDSVSDNKYIDELARIIPRFLMLPIVLFDNIGIRFISIFLNGVVDKYAAWYSKKCKNSSLISQTIAVPWLKPFHEPKHKKTDVYPVKEYNFEGRLFYSYNNLKEVLVGWYGPNCLIRLKGKKYYDPFPVEKRSPKHVKYINFDGEGRIK